MTLINFDGAEDKDIDAALLRIQEEEKSLSIIDSGDILHTFALKCLLSVKDEYDKSTSELAIETKQYIDDLLANDKLPPLESDRDEFYYDRDTAHGYGIWILEDYRNEYNDIKNHLKSCRKKSLEKLYPTYINEIKEEMKNNIDKFREIISRGPNKLGKYAEIPVMTSISPADFVAKWLSRPRPQWYEIRKALEYRYDTGLLRNALRDESEWIKSVIREIKDKAATETGLRRLRIERLIPSVSVPDHEQ